MLCAAAVSGRLLPLAVEVVPSRTARSCSPQYNLPLPRSCNPVMVASGRRRWWLHIHGGVCWRVVTLVVARHFLEGSCAVDRPGLRIGFLWEKSLLAWTTPTRCHLWMASLLPEGRRGNPSSASLSAEGNRSACFPSSRCCLVLDDSVPGARW